MMLQALKYYAMPCLEDNKYGLKSPGAVREEYTSRLKDSYVKSDDYKYSKTKRAIETQVDSAKAARSLTLSAATLAAGAVTSIFHPALGMTACAGAAILFGYAAHKVSNVCNNATFSTALPRQQNP